MASSRSRCLPPRPTSVIAFGAFAGGVAIDNYSASATVITGLILSVVTIAVAWGTSFLRPPVVEESSQATAQAVPEPA